jgi:Integrase core domain
MDASFCVAALEEALARHGKPEIFNTDQGSQFTSADFTSVLIDVGVRISIDGRGRWMDNVFIERVWRSLKYEDVYLKGYADGREAKAGIGAYFAFYNEQRLHQALAYRTPRAVLRDGGGAGSLWTCGQRIRVYHRPTGRSETAADRTLGGLIKDNQQTASNLTAAKNGPACAGPLQSEIIERCYPRHGGREFLSFLREIERNVPSDLDVRLIMDNYATHKTPAIRKWLGLAGELACSLHAGREFLGRSGRALLHRRH